jgi:hypothetical protein
MRIALWVPNATLLVSPFCGGEPLHIRGIEDLVWPPHRMDKMTREIVIPNDWPFRVYYQSHQKPACTIYRAHQDLSRKFGGVGAFRIQSSVLSF